MSGPTSNALSLSRGYAPWSVRKHSALHERPLTREVTDHLRPVVRGIRHRTASSVDFDFHRGQAAALRRLARRDAATLKAVAIVMTSIVGIASLLLAVIANHASAS